MRPPASPGFVLVAVSFVVFAVRNGLLGDTVELLLYSLVAVGALLLAAAFRRGPPEPRLLLAGAVLPGAALALGDVLHVAGGGRVGSFTVANLLWAWGFGLAAWHGAAWARAPAEAQRRAAGMSLGLSLAAVAYAAYFGMVAMRLGEALLLGGHAVGLAGAALAAVALGPAQAPASRAGGGPPGEPVPQARPGPTPP